MKRLLALAVLLLVALPAFAGGKSAQLWGSTVLQNGQTNPAPTPAVSWDLDGTMTGTPGYITAPVDGVYEIEAFISFGFQTLPTSPKFVSMQVETDGNQPVGQGTFAYFPYQSTAVSFAQKMKLFAGTKYHMTVNQQTGGPATVYRKFSLTLVQ